MVRSQGSCIQVNYIASNVFQIQKRVCPDLLKGPEPPEPAQSKHEIVTWHLEPCIWHLAPGRTIWTFFVISFWYQIYLTLITRSNWFWLKQKSSEYSWSSSTTSFKESCRQNPMFGILFSINDLRCDPCHCMIDVCTIGEDRVTKCPKFTQSKSFEPNLSAYLATNLKFKQSVTFRELTILSFKAVLKA